MSVIPIDQIVGQSSNNTQQKSNIIPIDQIIGNQQLNTSNESDTMKDLESASSALNSSAPINKAKGLIGTTLGAMASGAMKGSEGILETEQGATNIVGGALSAVSGGKIAPPSQIFAQTAQQMEADRQRFLGNQESLHGKVLENIAQLPALVGMLGSPESAGLLGTRGTLEAFAGQAALQAQPQTQGRPIKEQLGNMSWQGTKGAAFGAVIGKAIKMGNVTGPALAGAYTAGVQGLSGGDPNDILAGAITGAGMTTLSNPKILASVLSSTGETVSNIGAGAKATFEALKTKGPLTAAAGIIGSKGTDYYQKIQDMVNAPDKIAQIDQKIAQAKNEQQETQKNLVENQQLLKAQADQEKLNTDNATKDALTNLEKQQSIMESNVSSILAQKSLEISNGIDKVSKELSGEIDNTVSGLKAGKLRQFFTNISTAFTTATDAMGKLFSETSQKPLTRADGIDAATHALEQIADANGNIDTTSPTAQALNRVIDFFKNTPLKSSAKTADQIRNMRAAGVPEAAIQQYKLKQGKIDLSKPVPFDTVKALFDRAKNADPYGSHEGDIARKSFAELIEKKLSENGQDTTQFRKIMSDMSDAISYKSRLSRIFQLKEGVAYSDSGFKFLKEIATGKDETGKIINPSASKLLDVLQNGLSIGDIKATGVGDIASSLQQMGENLSKLQDQYTNIGYKEKATIANIGKNFVARMAAEKAQGKLTKQTIDLEHKRVMESLVQVKNQLNQNTEMELQRFAGDRAKQEELLERKKDIASVVGVMGLTVSVYASKIGYAFRAISKLGMRNATGLGKNP